jgi:N-methylhydantoinase A
MVRALRLISVERGLDPRDFALVAFGGAGGLHACALAEELGCVTVLVPRAAGVLSALGLAISEVRHDHVRPFTSRRDDELEPAFVEAESAALTALPDAELLRQADLRYAGQSFELTVPGRTRPELEAAFGEAHERRYGHRIDDEPIEIVNLRLVATRAGVVPDLRGAERPGFPGAAVGTRRVLLDVGEVDATVHDRTLMGPGSAVTGPAVVEMPEATCLVRPGWAGQVDEVGTLVLRREVR